MNLISPRLSINIGKNITKLWQGLDGHSENIGKHCKILRVLNYGLDLTWLEGNEHDIAG